MMFDGYIIDRLTRDMLDKIVVKEKLELLEENYLTMAIKEIYDANGVVRIEILGDNRYDVIGSIYYLNVLLSKIVNDHGIGIEPTVINKLIAIEGNSPNNFILESDVNGRTYELISKGCDKPRINLVFEVIANKIYTAKKKQYLIMLYDRRYGKKGFVEIPGTIEDSEHYRISDEIAYACLPINHNSTRY